MSGHRNSHHRNTPPAGTKRRRTSNGLRQPEQTALHQDQVSSELSSLPHTSTPTSHPTTASRSTSSVVGSRVTPIEILSSGDESPSASRAGRRRQSASSNTSTPSSRPGSALHAARPKATIRPHPTTASRSTSSVVGSRATPIEILSLGDESPSASRAGRRRQSASSNTSTPSSRPGSALHAARPKAQIWPVSDPLPRRVQQQPPNSDTAIEALIREPPKTREGRASVYIMTATHKGKPIVKIGFTTSVNQRIKQLEQTCRCIEFHRVTTDLHPPPIELYYGTVERLAHIELQRFRYDFNCTCKKRHGEYFVVDAETARHIVQRWTQFCEARPWEAAEAGQKLELKDQWRDRLAGWKDEHGRPVAVKDFNARLAQWDRFVRTPRWKWLWYDIRVWSAWLSRFWWQALFVVVCVVIRCLVRDRGWLARGAECAMLLTIVSLGGFRCVASEGLFEPLLKTGWIAVMTGPKEKGDDYSRKVIYQDIWADSGNNYEDWDDGYNREDKDDMGNREDKKDIDCREDKDKNDDRDNRDSTNNKNDIDNRDKRDNRDDKDDLADSSDSDDSEDTNHTVRVDKDEHKHRNNGVDAE